MSLNKFNKDQIKDVDNSTPAELNKFQLASNIFLTAVQGSEAGKIAIEVAASASQPAVLTMNDKLLVNTSSVQTGDLYGLAGIREIYATELGEGFAVQAVDNISPQASHIWEFNEGSGTTASDSVGDINMETSGEITWGADYIDVDGSSGEILATPNGSLYDMDDFSVVLWVTPKDLLTNRYFLGLSAGSSTGASDDSWGIYHSGSTLGAFISNGVDSHITNPITINTTDKFFIVMTYKRNGGASDNEFRLRATTDGVTWHNIANNSAILMQKNSEFELRNAVYTNGGANAKYYRVEIFNGSVLSDSQMQALFDAGSESGIPGTIPENSKYIGKIHFDGSSTATIYDSLSSRLIKEVQTISGDTTELTLSEIEYLSDDNPLIFINGDLQVLNTNYTLTLPSSLSFNDTLVSGDKVAAIKIKNNATFKKFEVIAPAAASEHLWTFNEGSGSTANDTGNVGGINFTLANGSWPGDGSYSIAGSSSSDLVSATDILTVRNSFSVVLWLEFVSLIPTTRGTFGYGNASGGANAWAVQARTRAIQVAITDQGGSVRNVIAPSTVTTGDKYLVVFTYQYVGGASNNIAKIRYTKDGSTWVSTTDTLARLIREDINHALRNAVGAAPNPTKHYRTEYYENKVLTDQEMQDLWDAGSEA